MGSVRARAGFGGVLAGMISLATVGAALIDLGCAAEAVTQAAPPEARPAAAPPAAKPAGHQPPEVTALGLPPVEVTPQIMDFGKVRPSQKVSNDFNLLNISDKALKILTSKASCTCTTVNLENTTIAPGESVALHVEYRGTSGTGPKESAVRVLIEGYDIMELQIKANITSPIMADPSYISVLKGDDGSLSNSGEFVVRSEDQKPFKVLSVDLGPVAFADFDPAKDEPRNSYRVKWDFSMYDPMTGRNAAGRKIPGFLLVETDRADCPVIDLEVRHNALRRPRPAPTDQWLVQEKRVSVGPIASGKSAEFELLGKWIPKAKMDDPIESVVSESKDFTAELVKSDRTGDSIVCRVKITPVAGFKGLINGNIRLQSKNQSWPILIIGAAQ